MTITELINKKIKLDGGYTQLDIDNAEKELGLKLPSDLVDVLLQTKQIVFEQQGLEISLDKVSKWIEFRGFHNLEWLVQERKNDLSNDVYIFMDEYLQIGDTFGQDLILIGFANGKENSICFYSEEDEIIKLCDSIYDFINNHLML